MDPVCLPLLARLGLALLPRELAEQVEHPEGLSDAEREVMRANVGRLAGVVAAGRG